MTKKGNVFKSANLSFDFPKNNINNGKDIKNK